MRLKPASLPDVLLVEPELFEGERSHFFESYHLQRFATFPA